MDFSSDCSSYQCSFCGANALHPGYCFLCEYRFGRTLLSGIWSFIVGCGIDLDRGNFSSFANPHHLQFLYRLIDPFIFVLEQA